MRDLAFAAVLAGLLPLVVARPFVGVILWSWLSFMNPHQIVWGFAGSLPWAQIVFVTTVLGCIVNSEPRRFPVNAVTLLLLLLMACVTLTSFAAIGPPASVWAYWERVFKIVLGLMLTAALLTDRWRIHALVWIMVISVGFFGVSGGIFTLVTGGSYRVFGPPNTMIGDNNHVATGMLVTLPLMNYLRMHSRHHLVRLGMLAAMGLTLLAVLGTQSRGALLALAALAVVMWLRSRGKIISGIVLGIALAGGIAFMPDSWTARMNTIATYQEDESASDRLVVWGINYKLAMSRPLTGVGFTGPYHQAVVDTVEPGGQARAVHSIWFAVIGEHGFPTFAVWLALNLAGLIYAMRIARLTRKRPDLAWAHDLARMAQVSMVAYAVGGTFLSLSYWDFFWTLLILMGATHMLVRQALGSATQPGWRAALGAGGGRNWRQAAPAARLATQPPGGRP